VASREKNVVEGSRFGIGHQAFFNDVRKGISRDWFKPFALFGSGSGGMEKGLVEDPKFRINRGESESGVI
jgi:hypothetical protein